MPKRFHIMTSPCLQLKTSVVFWLWTVLRSTSVVIKRKSGIISSIHYKLYVHRQTRMPSNVRGIYIKKWNRFSHSMLILVSKSPTYTHRREKVHLLKWHLALWLEMSTQSYVCSPQCRVLSVFFQSTCKTRPCDGGISVVLIEFQIDLCVWISIGRSTICSPVVYRFVENWSFVYQNPLVFLFITNYFIV